PYVDKLRKPELINKIVENSKEGEANNSSSPPVQEGDKPRRRTRKPKTSEVVNVTNKSGQEIDFRVPTEPKQETASLFPTKEKSETITRENPQNQRAERKANTANSTKS